MSNGEAGEAAPRRRMSITRMFSPSAAGSGRDSKGSPADAFEYVDFDKPEGCMIGLTIAAPWDKKVKGVVAAEVEQRGALAKANVIFAGDAIYAVNGTPCYLHQEAAALIKAAKGVITFKLRRNVKCPRGWETLTEADGRPYYKHGPSGKETYSHPAAVARRPMGTIQFYDSDSDDEADEEAASEQGNRTSRGHAVASVITNMQTKKKMIKDVQKEADIHSPAKAAQGGENAPRFQSVSL